MTSAALLVAIMVLGSFVLWIGVPFAWLWIGSQVQGETSSLGLAVAVMIAGVALSIFAIVVVLSRLSDAYGRDREARGLEDVGHFPLEVVLVSSATVALVGFVTWFFLFAGTSPIPINISY